MDQEEVVNDTAASETTETRREMLKKIGLALAAVPVAAALAHGEAAQAQPKVVAGDLKLDPKVKTLVSGVEGKEFSLFFAKAQGRGVASVVVIPDTDRTSTSTALKNLGGKPARGKVVGGVLQIDLGAAAEGRCSGNSGSIAAASFNPVDGGDPFKGAPIIRTR